MECEALWCSKKPEYKCSVCGVAVYCSKKCKDKDWNFYHKKECPDICEFKNPQIGEVITITGIATVGALGALATAANAGAVGLAIHKFRRKRAMKEIEELAPKLEELEKENVRLRQQNKLEPNEPLSIEIPDKVTLETLKLIIKIMQERISDLEEKNKNLQ